MKAIFYILTFLHFTFMFSQVSKEKIYYIKKDNVKGHSQSIFVEKNKASQYYKDLTSFTLDSFDVVSYKNSLDYFKKKNEFLRMQKTILPSTKWVELNQYKKKFYVYYPCDFNNLYQVSINDSTYIEWTGEGPIANKIQNQIKTNNQTYILRTSSVYDNDKIIQIKIIDKNKGIAVFKETNKKNIHNYYLMIMIEKIKSVPFIVNNCETQKQLELNFEEPNFEKLIKKK